MMYKIFVIIFLVFVLVETENDGKQMNYVFVFCPKLYIMKQEKYFQFHFNIMLVVLHD